MQNVYETQITIKGQKIGRYILEKKLGSGQFGTVWRARTEDTNEVFAIKKIKMELINKSKEALNLLRTEIAIMNEINHPNILHLFEFIYSKKHYYLVVQYCDQGDFENYMEKKGIKFFEEPEAVYFLKQIMNGFMVLRERKILHRDFKLANIFVNDEKLVIGDFGFAKQGFETAQTVLGTPLTMAPEILLPPEDQPISYNSKADLWSIGVVFYQILFGVLPFNGNSIPQLKMNIRNVLASGLPFPKPVSEEAKNLLRGLLTLEPKDRIEWSAFFSHPLFRSSQNSDITKITLTFGQIGEMNMSSIDQEFRNNMKKKDLGQNVNFVIDNKGLEGLNKGMNPREDHEVVLNNNQMNKIIAHNMAKEVNFRLSHELNKVYFLIYSVHKIQKSQKFFELSQLAGIAVNVSILAIIKAKFMNTKIRNCIEKRQNPFKLNENALQNFFNSEFKDQLKNYVELNEKGLSDHLILLVKRCKENNLNLTCRNLISKDVLENAINQALTVEVVNFTKSLPLEQFPDKVLNRNIVMYKVIAKLIRDPEINFSYLAEKTKDAKFNWNRLYYILERLPIEELRNNV